jgi:hypothetical protein
MALRMEKTFGAKMDTLMRMQASSDIAQTHKRRAYIRAGPWTCGEQVHIPLDVIHLVPCTLVREIFCREQ